VTYAAARGKSLVIVPCAAHRGRAAADREREYYERLLGASCQFSEWREMSSAYDAIDRAEVTVSIDSTLGYESIARGNKTAMFSIRSRLLEVPGLTYGWPEEWPDEGPFWTNLPDPAIFERILDHLFSLDAQQWRAERDRSGFASIMIHDPGNTILQSILHQALGEARRVPTRAEVTT
jgi:surface carbohydrate biosynthesis protein